MHAGVVSVAESEYACEDITRLRYLCEGLYEFVAIYLHVVVY